MRAAEFEKIVDGFLDVCRHTLLQKRKEYADDGDVLRNFKTVAVVVQSPPTSVAITYLMKHIQSIADSVADKRYLDDWAWVKQTDGVYIEGLKQRFADAICYLLLGAATIEEARIG